MGESYLNSWSWDDLILFNGVSLWKDLSALLGTWVSGLLPKLLISGLPLFLDPSQPMFYLRALTLEDVVVMKSGIHFGIVFTTMAIMLPIFNGLWLI